MGRLLERTAGHGRMRHMGACTLLAVFLVMSVSGAEDVQPADDVPAMAGPAVYMKQHRLGESHGNSGEVASLNAEDRADGYHKLRRTEVPAYAVVLETRKLSGSKCKAQCNQVSKCEGYKHTSGSDECLLLAHRDNAQNVFGSAAKKAADKAHVVKEVVVKMRSTVRQAADKTAEAEKQLFKEKQAVALAHKKTGVAKQKAKVDAQVAREKKNEYAKATSILEGQASKIKAQIHTRATTLQSVKKEANATKESAKAKMTVVKSENKYLVQEVAKQTSVMLKKQIQDRKQALVDKLNAQKAIAKEQLRVAKKEYERLKDKADEFKLELKTLKARGPRRQVLPPVASPINVTKAEQKIDTSKNNPFVAKAIAKADKVARTKIKNIEFSNKLLGGKNGTKAATLKRAVKKTMKKEEEKKAEKSAVSKLSVQKADVKHIAKKAKKLLKKSGMSPSVKAKLKRVLGNATAQVAATESRKKLDGIEISASRNLTNVVADFDAANERKVKQKGRDKTAKFLKKVKQVEHVQKEWVEKRLAAFEPQDKAHFLPKLVKLSRNITTTFPTSERLRVLKEAADEMVAKERKILYRKTQEKNEKKVIALRAGGDAALARNLTKKFDKKIKARRARRAKAAENAKARQAARVADATAAVENAKKDFKKQFVKVTLKRNETKVAEQERSMLLKKTKKMKARVKQLANMAKHPTKIVKTDVVNSKGKVVQETVSKPGDKSAATTKKGDSKKDSKKANSPEKKKNSKKKEKEEKKGKKGAKKADSADKQKGGKKKKAAKKADKADKKKGGEKKKGAKKADKADKKKGGKKKKGAKKADKADKADKKKGGKKKTKKGVKKGGNKERGGSSKQGSKSKGKRTLDVTMSAELNDLQAA